MDETPFAPPAVSAVGAPEAGGRLPEVGQLLSETFAEFSAKLVPYALAGLGLTLVVFPVTLVLVLVAYVLLIGAMLGVSLVGVGVGAGIAEAVDPAAGGFVMVVSQLLAIGLPLGGVVFLLFGVIALTAPLNASLVRAVAAQQRGGPDLTLAAAFTTARNDLGKVLIGGCLIVGLSGLGVLACYVPSLLVLLLFGFASSLIALHGLPPLAALRASGEHARAHLGWHLMVQMVYLGLIMVGSYVPIVGPMFATAFHVRAYRGVFGDDAEPLL